MQVPFENASGRSQWISLLFAWERLINPLTLKPGHERFQGQDTVLADPILEESRPQVVGPMNPPCTAVIFEGRELPFSCRSLISCSDPSPLLFQFKNAFRLKGNLFKFISISFINYFYIPEIPDLEIFV